MIRHGYIILIGVLVFGIQQTSASMWLWECNSFEGTCTRNFDSENSNGVFYPSIELCRLVCGKCGGLWPKPTISTEMSTTFFSFAGSSIKFDIPTDNSDVENFLKAASDIFLSLLPNDSSCSEDQNTVTISFEISSPVMDLTWTTDESYNLTVKSEGSISDVRINSGTVFGARHGLETLSQLIEIYPTSDKSSCLVIVQNANISDKPTFSHRGLLLDTARNFLSIDSIKKHIDGMSYTKLNVLHWHITDSQSFPLELKSLPNMTKYGAYSDEKIYHSDEIKELLSYAKQRGVRIIIEIDAPSHSGNGWQWGPDAGLGNLAVCVGEQPWRSYCIQPPCGQLNPINPNLYMVLKDLYADITNILPKGEIFHMGGDEVYIPCWNSTPEIINYLSNKSRTLETFLDLWAYYQSNALKVYDSVVGNADTPIILWTSHLTDVGVIEKYLSKERYIIQTWVPASDPLPQDLLALGYRIIVSTKDTWYLDHGFWGNTLYHSWRTVYNNRIPLDTGTVGGEVCMWGEYVDDVSIEPKVWPRASAAAERLWTNPISNANDIERRFYRHRERLISRGINAEALVPKWCYQNEGECR